jgi:PAS domain S-box-containing protein
MRALHFIMASSSPPSSGSGASGRPSPPQFLGLSRTFWRGVTSIQGLGPAIQKLLAEFNAHTGTRRASVWLHNRRSRELSVVASSDPAYAAATPRIASGDQNAPAARGLRLDRSTVLDDRSDPILIAPLRGWRRALGTLVVEGPAPGGTDRQQQLDLAGEIGRYLSVGIENVQLIEEMLWQRRLLEDTFNSLVDLVVVTDRALRVVQMNDAFAARLGRSRNELLERSLADLIGGELAQWAAGADAPHETARVRTLHHERLGGMFHMTATPLINEAGEPVGTVLVARDITRQTALEGEQDALRARLAQSEKLASLGQFVAGIAHEINNPLQGVLGHLELLLWSPPDDAAATVAESRRAFRKDLRRIYHEADRAAKIVGNLLTFTGSQRLTRRRLRVDRTLTRALALRRTALVRAGIEIVRTQGEHVPAILGDQLLLQQAFFNILLNAEHAIAAEGRGGSIFISTSSPEPHRVRITMRDSGPGIPPTVLPRIFDPFFTTKDVGQGTGLGLTLTYGVIQEHGGTIHVSNAPEGGATFIIDLPAAREP